MKKITTAILSGLFISSMAQADQVILDDLIVDGSSCVGQDCVNGESFGFDTIRLKENNLRIKFQDTSNSASFPTNDWQLTANDSANGGLNKFSIDDIDGGKTPFTIEAGAPSHSLYVDDGGRIGLGTSTPSVEIHVKDGDTPTLRLEQDGSSGFTAQTWDLAGNETNFFIRDVTNGSKLPFRIRPNAPTSSIDVAANGDIGLGGVSSPLDAHVTFLGDSTQAGFKLCQVSGDCNAIGAGNGANYTLYNNDLYVTNRENGNLYFFTDNTQKLALNADNNHVLTGNLTISGDCTEVDGACAPDYVFQSDYKLLAMDELQQYIKANKHLPNVPKGTLLEQNGINIQKFSYTLLEKIEELTLYTLEQHQTIAQLQADIERLKADRSVASLQN